MEFYVLVIQKNLALIKAFDFILFVYLFIQSTPIQLKFIHLMLF
jgi:hypothetical protein